MLLPLGQPLERGWVGRLDGDRVVQLAAQSLAVYFTGRGLPTLQLRAHFSPNKDSWPWPRVDARGQDPSTDYDGTFGPVY